MALRVAWTWQLQGPLEMRYGVVASPLTLLVIVLRLALISRSAHSKNVSLSLLQVMLSIYPSFSRPSALFPTNQTRPKSSSSLIRLREQSSLSLSVRKQRWTSFGNSGFFRIACKLICPLTFGMCCVRLQTVALRRYKTLKRSPLKRSNPERRRKRRASYSAYLRSPEWRGIRALVLDRANGLCERCQVPTMKFEVHHKSYAHTSVKLVTHEPLHNLVALCARCHRVEEFLRRSSLPSLP